MISRYSVDTFIKDIVHLFSVIEVRVTGFIIVSGVLDDQRVEIKWRGRIVSADGYIAVNTELFDDIAVDEFSEVDESSKGIHIGEMAPGIRDAIEGSAASAAAVVFEIIGFGGSEPGVCEYLEGFISRAGLVGWSRERVIPLFTGTERGWVLAAVWKLHPIFEWSNRW